MTGADQLDLLLLAWLSEAQARRAESRFSQYFAAAFPALCRYLRALGAEPSVAEDIAQQSLIKLCERLGAERQQAYARLRSALRSLQSAPWSVDIDGVLARWVAAVDEASAATVGFTMTAPGLVRDASGWERRSHLNAQLELLVAQGRSLLDQLRPTTRTQAPVLELCACLPLLAIPSNGWLFTVAKRALIDHWRSGWNRRVSFSADLETGPGDGLLDALEVDATDGANATWLDAAVPAAAPDADAAQIDSEQWFRSFAERIRAPLTRAEGALAIAASAGSTAAERRRVERLQFKYDRLMLVLSALCEDPQPTETEIAARLGVTRNQVKYAIARIRAEFGRHGEASPGQPREQQRMAARSQAHVKPMD